MRVLAEGASRSHLWLLRLPDLEVLTLVLEMLPRPNRELISNGCWQFSQCMGAHLNAGKGASAVLHHQLRALVE